MYQTFAVQTSEKIKEEWNIYTLFVDPLPIVIYVVGKTPQDVSP